MTHSLFDLAGRVAIVSGGASGLGQAIAVALAESGADLLLPLRSDTEGMRETVAQIERFGRRASVVRCDVSDPSQLDEMFRRLDAEFGRVDVLFNVAGNGMTGSPEDITLEQIRITFQNLVFGRFYCCQLAGRRMLAAGRGSIVNIGSIASMTALGRGHIAYSMAMGAVVQMTRELSTEWSSRGVRVNAILPAQVPSQRNHLIERMENDPELRETGSCAGFPPAGWVCQRTSRDWPCSWHPTRRRGSPARSFRWMAEIWPRTPAALIRNAT